MSETSISQITSDLQHLIKKHETRYEVRNIGTVIEAGDGIAQVSGLSGIRSQELVEFENRVMGIAFNLEQNRVGIIILGDYGSVTEGMKVHSTGRIASVPVGESMIGRVVDALGQPLDGKGPIADTTLRPIERLAAGVIERQDVDTPVQTGIIAIDSMVPIGRGQRQLIIGDRQTGKTALAIDTIINQKDKDLICIYVAIGQKKSSIARTIDILEKNGAMKKTIIVVASADDTAALQYIVPYSGCAIGEAFMDNGKDALLVFDDLTKHAWAYRQVSLLLNRPPGREAYPGDVFYLHSRLLERAARLAYSYVIVPKEFPHHHADAGDAVDGKVYVGTVAHEEAQRALKEMKDFEAYKIVKVKGTGGSLTALPIIETTLGDVSAYVPTNVISITDGQIYLEAELFNAGVRPAINVGISVSRVGGAAQVKAMKRVAGSLRLDMAVFRDLAAFAQFGSDLDKATQAQLNRGGSLQEILKQPQYSPMPLEEQVVVLFAGTQGYADHIPADQIKKWQIDLLAYVEAHSDAMKEIRETKTLSDAVSTELRGLMDTFNKTWQQ